MSSQGTQWLLSLAKPAASQICEVGCYPPAACNPNLPQLQLIASHRVRQQITAAAQSISHPASM